MVERKAGGGKELLIHIIKKGDIPFHLRSGGCSLVTSRTGA